MSDHNNSAETPQLPSSERVRAAKRTREPDHQGPAAKRAFVIDLNNQVNPIPGLNNQCRLILLTRVINILRQASRRIQGDEELVARVRKILDTTIKSLDELLAKCSK
jgi:hypothetical protein